MKHFYIVPHSHLDREWYKTFQENRIKLTHFMDDFLETMTNDSRYRYYTLDAQTSFLDDYFDVKPEKRAVFQLLASQGRIIIGPWYVQPDEFIPSAEGLIRNLLIGRRMAEEFGESGKIAYLPDSFGQSGCLPEILKGFEIGYAVIYRGLSEEDSKYNDFIWKGIDGSELVANWMPVGYGNAMFLCDGDDDKNIHEIEENIKLLEERSISNNYLLMCGSDQSYIKKFLPATVERLNELFKEEDYVFSIASLQEYMDAVSDYKPDMETVTGDLRKGKHGRTHNSVDATRIDIKKKYRDTESKYQYILEPLNALCTSLGCTDDSALINRGWKYIADDQAHDSICCCCTDPIHKELIARLDYADQAAEFLIQEKMQALNERISYQKGLGRPILLFSMYPDCQTKIIETDVYSKENEFVIKDGQGECYDYDVLSSSSFNLKDTKISFTPVPDDIYQKKHIRLEVKLNGAGYKTLYVVEGKRYKSENKQYAHDNVLENEKIRLSVEKDGTWTITDKIIGNIYSNQHLIVDDGNAGDEYDYSPSFADRRVTSLNTLKSITVKENSSLQGTLELTYCMQIPYTTDNDSRSEELVDLIVREEVTVKRKDKRLYIKTVLMNTALNHRVQVLFNIGKRVDQHLAGVQLGGMVRDNEFSETTKSEKEWSERYYPVFCSHKFSALMDGDEGIAVISANLPQYEIYQEQNQTLLALTLLSSVGKMGNVNLKYRPGRRSGSADETPDSQMLGEQMSEYIVYPVAKQDDIINIAEQSISPVISQCFVEYDEQGILPDDLLLAKCDSGIIISALKEAEARDGLIIRFLNPHLRDIPKANVYVNQYLFNQLKVVNLAENEINEKRVHLLMNNNPDGSALAKNSGCIQFDDFGHNQMITLKLSK